MWRILIFVGIAWLLCPTVGKSQPVKGRDVPHEVYRDFIDRSVPAKSDEEKSSYLVYSRTNKAEFDSRFVLRATLVAGKNPVPLPKDVFSKNLVVAIVKRGKTPTKYTIQQVTVDDDVLVIRYKTTAQMPPAEKPVNGIIASPLLITTEQGKLKIVKFIENEKPVSTIEVK